VSPQQIPGRVPQFPSYSVLPFSLHNFRSTAPLKISYRLFSISFSTTVRSPLFPRATCFRPFFAYPPMIASLSKVCFRTLSGKVTTCFPLYSLRPSCLERLFLLLPFSGSVIGLSLFDEIVSLLPLASLLHTFPPSPPHG